MKKKIMIVIMIIAMGMVGLSPLMTEVVHATAKIDNELAKLKIIKEEAQRKAREAAAQMSQVKDQQQTTKEEMENLLNQIDWSSQKLSQLNEKIDDVSNELIENGKLLDATAERIKSQEELLRSRIRLIYMNGIVSYMDVLLSSTSFSDFLNRIEILTIIAAEDKKLLDQGIQDRNLIVEKRKQTESQLNEVKNLYEESNQVRQELYAKEKEKEVKLQSLAEQEELLEGITAENERLLIEYARQESELLRKKADLLDLPYSGGKMGYPLAITGIFTSYYGYRKDPITGNLGAFHSGIDLAAPEGTSILAAETGVVIVASWFGGYGNCVIIDHGRNTWTLYGHIRNDGIVIKKGDKVKKGQKIAEVGSTGRSTGNHLHFEVRLNEQTVDPLPYIR